MRYLALLLAVAGCADHVVVPPAGCEPIGEGVLSFSELAGDCGALPDLEGVLDAGRIESDPRGYRCVYRPTRDDACGLSLELTCEPQPPFGERELEATLALVEPGRWAGQATQVVHPLDGGVGCRSTYSVEARNR